MIAYSLETSNLSHRYSRQQRALDRVGWEFMGFFLLPIGVILTTSLVTQLEFRSNTWKQLHTTPQSKNFLAQLGYFAAFTVVGYILYISWVIVTHWPAWILLTLPQVVSFYMFYLVLFLRFLKTKRLFLLGVWGFVVAGLSPLVGFAVSGPVYGWKYGPHFNLDGVAEWSVLGAVCCVHGVLGLILKGFFSWYEDIHLKERLHRKNFEMELALLKSQLNPHFLFNTLNNIDVLIRKDADRASLYLNQLSDILRFMLYEASSEQISIHQELQYIDKYIQLQKIRTAHPEYIHYSVEGEAGERWIEPMLFIPFIENAFKHAGKKAENAIRVRFTFAGDRINFVCENKFNSVGGGTGAGLGNELIRRRLALLYPDRHRLDINIHDDIDKATLEIRYAN